MDIGTLAEQLHLWATQLTEGAVPLTSITAGLNAVADDLLLDALGAPVEDTYDEGDSEARIMAGMAHGNRGWPTTTGWRLTTLVGLAATAAVAGLRVLRLGGVLMPEIPSLQDINIALARLRAAGTAMNLKDVKTDSNFAYSPPEITVTQMVEVWHEGKMTNPACESVAMQLTWDHSDWAIYEAIEVAQQGEGKVYIEQGIVSIGTLDAQDDPSTPAWTAHADEGFSMEVWPNFDGTNKHDKDKR